MLRAIDNKAVELSEAEYEYYKLIIKEFGMKAFQNLIDVDDFGLITLVRPPLDNVTPLGVIFFCFNVMLNQRIREFEKITESLRQK